MLKKFSIFLGLLIILVSLLATNINSFSQTITNQSDSSSEMSSSSTSKETSTSEINPTESGTEFEKRNVITSKSDESFSQEDQQTETTNSNSNSATQNFSVKSVISNVITNTRLSDAQGNPINEVYPWSNIQMNFDFSLPNNTVRQGDTTIITLPDELKFRNSQSFEIRNSNGDIIANAKIDPDTKQVVITYTDFAETHSDISGSFFFQVAVDETKVTTSKTIPIVLDINGTPRPVQDIRYVKIGDSADERFMKYGYFDNNAGTVMDYVVRVNASGQNYTGASVEDSLKSDGITYDKSSFRIFKGTWKLNSSGFFALEDEEDVTSQFPIQFSTNDRGFTVNFGDLHGEGYRINYKVNTNHNPVNGELFRNSAQMKGNNTVVDSRIADIIYQTAGGSGDGYNYTITLHKKDELGNSLAGAEFDVIRDATGSTVGRIITDSSGVGRIQGLLKDNYTIRETKAPNGYQQIQDDIKISPADFNSSKEVVKDVVNAKQEETKIALNGQKVWNDNNNQDGKRPASIKVNLLANGTVIQSKEISAADSWKYEFTDLAKNDSNGNLIKYSITEDQITDYNTEYQGNNIINSYTPGETSIGVTKSWDDWYNQDGLRPNSIQVQLYANEKVSGNPVTLNDGNNWHTVWSNLPEKLNGQTINYTVKEIGELKGYSTTIDDENIGNIIITNFHKPETTSVKGKKTWDDNNDQDKKRPQIIKINLLANGKIIDNKNVSSADNWEYSFENVPKYENGELITYSITEDQVPEYNTSYDGYNVTNSYTPGKTSVGVTKSWDDKDNQDGIRPIGIQVQLYANGQANGDPVTLNDDNNWHTVWNDLPEKSNGQTITYKVLEVETPNGYSTLTNDSDLGNIIITNFHEPDVTQVKGKKTWNDNNDQDGKRPASIRIHLLADGKEIDVKEVSAADNWEYSFNNLPKRENGNVILYSVIEDQIQDYSTTYDGYDIINSYTPGQTSISVTKTWNDKDNQDNVRPNSIKVQLYANGQAFGSPIELNESNRWSATWNELAEKSNGQTIQYEVKEVAELPGYSATVDKITPGNIILTNTHTPETIKVEGKKSWDDNNNQDGKRPSSIKVHLLANGKEIDTKEITADDNWSYSFDNLPRYNSGQEITYTISEDQVTDYTSIYNGYDITNKYTPGKTNIHVSKVWNDKNNQDNLRPNSISVQLFADGKPSGVPITLNSKNNWEATWNNLAEKANGKTIAYTVKEVTNVKGYVTTINEINSGNVIITNSHTPETTIVEGEKKWIDDNNKDGKRPTSITVHLLADGKEIAKKQVTAKENWKYTFRNLPKNNNGKTINYSITEDQVVNYTTTYDGYNIINKYTPKKTSIHVTKAWIDNNDQDSIRPKNIKVQLYANGQKSGSPVELNSDNQWSKTWGNLEEKVNNQLIVYSVKEIGNVDGYSATINDDNLGNIIITNTHTPKNNKYRKIVKPKNLTKNNYPKTGEKQNFLLNLMGVAVLVILFNVLRKKH